MSNWRDKNDLDLTSEDLSAMLGEGDSVELVHQKPPVITAAPAGVVFGAPIQTRSFGNVHVLPGTSNVKVSSRTGARAQAI